MNQNQNTDDPEPSERIPAGPLFVPVRSGPVGCAARLFRTPLGGRTAVGFTSEQRLAATLGPDQAWIRLAEPALRALTEPLGATTLTLDPQLIAPAVSPAAAPVVEVQPAARPAPVPAAAPGKRRPGRRTPQQTAGAMRVAGAAALVSCLSMLIG